MRKIRSTSLASRSTSYKAALITCSACPSRIELDLLSSLSCHSAHPQLLHLAGRTQLTLPRGLHLARSECNLHPTHPPHSRPAAGTRTARSCSQFAERALNPIPNKSWGVVPQPRSNFGLDRAARPRFASPAGAQRHATSKTTVGRPSVSGLARSVCCSARARGHAGLLSSASTDERSFDPNSCPLSLRLHV